MAGPEGYSGFDRAFRTLDPSVKSRLLYLAELRAQLPHICLRYIKISNMWPGDISSRTSLDDSVVKGQPPKGLCSIAKHWTAFEEALDPVPEDRVPLPDRIPRTEGLMLPFCLNPRSSLSKAHGYHLRVNIDLRLILACFQYIPHEDQGVKRTPGSGDTSGQDLP